MLSPLAVTGHVSRPCPWCRAPLALDSEHRGVVQCGSCRASATEPWPSDQELERAYGDWYRPESGGRFGGLGDRLLARSRGRLARRLDRIAPAGSVLDVGAGDGTLLRALWAAGRSAEGIERNASLPGMRSVDVTEIDCAWAAIVFWHSLEHLRAPGDSLDHAAGLLLPDGVLVVAVPNADSLQALVFGGRWFALDLPRHLVHLPACAVTTRLQELGLRVERVSHWRGGQIVFGWLHGLVGSLPGRPDLYDAIRRDQARRAPLSLGRRAGTLTAGALLLPIAAAAAIIEVMARRGGTVYVEARRV